MAITEGFLEYIVEQLRGAGTVTTRKMFGGAGVYIDGIITGLVADDILYLKVDDGNRGDFESQGMAPFQPFEDKPYSMSYYEVPPEVLEDPEELCMWAARSIEASLRSKSRK